MGKDKIMQLIDKFIDLGRIGEWIKGIETMIEIILRNRKIPYGYNSYLNEVTILIYSDYHKCKGKNNNLKVIYMVIIREYI